MMAGTQVLRRAPRRIAPQVLALAIAMPIAPTYAQVAPAAPSQPVTDESAAQAGDQAGGFRGFMRDVGRDYRNFFSIENAELATFGGVVTLAISQRDHELSSVDEPTPTALKAGSSYGNPAFQLPLAMTWWIGGHAAGSARAADAGRDLLRAQINAASWTYAIKYAVGRTRPNGDPRSFPSGHASAVFATAMVLQQHYGWKLGVPVFAAGVYTAAERVYDGKHWPSDVAFGAVVGMLSGRTVTLHLGHQRVRIEPAPRPGGGAVMVRVLR